jgi:hypothetical protein
MADRHDAVVDCAEDDNLDTTTAFLNCCAP